LVYFTISYLCYQKKIVQSGFKYVLLFVASAGYMISFESSIALLCCFIHPFVKIEDSLSSFYIEAIGCTEEEIKDTKGSSLEDILSEDAGHSF